MKPQNQGSFWGKSFNWLTNFAYRSIPVIITRESIKSSQPKSLFFEDYIKSPQLARQAGLMCVRQMKMDFIKRNEAIQKVVSEFKSRANLLTQKPHQFNCPICLEPMNGPVTTSCHHTFCHMCLDEAVLFNETCPVCRNKIRGEELIVSKSIENLIQLFLHKFQLEEVEKFVKKELQYEEWIERRSIKKENIDVGDCIDVRDTEFIWCRATILKIFPTDCETKTERQAILVHYEGWANVFNQLISLDSQRLAQYKFYTSREEIPHYNLSADNNQHLRSPVITGSLINRPPIMLQNSNSFEFEIHSENSSINLPADSIMPASEQSIQEDLVIEVSQSQNQRDVLGFQLLDENDDEIFPWYRQEVRRIRNIRDESYEYSFGDDLIMLNLPNRSHRTRSFEQSFIHNSSFSLQQQTVRRRRSEPNQQFNLSIPEIQHNRSEDSQHNQYKGQDYQFSQSFELESLKNYIESNIIRLNQSRNQRNLQISSSISSKSQTIDKNQQNQKIFKQDSHRNRFMELYFKSSEQIPFNVDIEEIKSSDFSLELKELERAQKQMQKKIEVEEEGVKSEIKKWNELNKMIDDYFQETQNPEDQIDDNPLTYNHLLHDSFQINCLEKYQGTCNIKQKKQYEKDQNEQQKQVKRFEEEDKFEI